MGRADEAIILAGGFGTRLRGVIDGTPKSLAPVAGRPFLAWMLDALAEQGLRRVVLATGYLGAQVEAACGPDWRGMQLAYSQEAAPLGTGGAIALALRVIEGEACFALNGDTRLELDFAEFENHAIGIGAILSVALAKVADVGRYGAVRLDRGRVAGLGEKDSSGPGYVNAGVYWMKRSVAALFPATAAFSFEHDVLIPAAACGKVAGFARTAGFIDIGVPEDYLRVQNMVAAPRGTAQ